MSLARFPETLHVGSAEVDLIQPYWSSDRSYVGFDLRVRPNGQIYTLPAEIDTGDLATQLGLIGSLVSAVYLRINDIEARVILRVA